LSGNSLALISFREVRIEDAALILDWRTKKRVSQFMLTDIEYNIAEQENWIKSCFSKPDYYHWIVQIGGRDAGLINIVDWNKAEATSSWGFYIGEDDLLGYGGMVPPYFYNFCFKQLAINTLTAQVFYNNTSTIKLHLLHGYRFAPEGDYVLTKNKKQILMVNLVLDKTAFLSSSFAKYATRFPHNHWLAYE